MASQKSLIPLSWISISKTCKIPWKGMERHLRRAATAGREVSISSQWFLDQSWPCWSMSLTPVQIPFYITSEYDLWWGIPKRSRPLNRDTKHVGHFKRGILDSMLYSLKLILASNDWYCCLWGVYLSPLSPWKAWMMNILFDYRTNFFINWNLVDQFGRPDNWHWADHFGIQTVH